MMHEETASPSPDRRTTILEIVAAVVLAFASQGATWSSYQAAEWGHTQATTSATIIKTLLDASRLATLAGHQTTIDVVSFTSWLEVYASGDEALAAFYQERFRDEFLTAFEAWIAQAPLTNPDAQPSPFAMEEYALAASREAAALREEAAALQVTALYAESNVSHYSRNTLFMASSLFFVAISRMFAKPTLRLTMLGLSVLSLLVGLVNFLRGAIA
jgi:hypothetical protein